MIIDLRKVEMFTPAEPVPTGEYPCEIVSFTLEESKESKQPMLVLAVKVLENKYTLKDFMVLTNEVGLSKLKKLLDLLGFDTDNEFNLENILNSDGIVGRTILCKVLRRCRVDEINEKTIYNELKTVLDIVE